MLQQATLSLEGLKNMTWNLSCSSSSDGLLSPAILYFVFCLFLELEGSCHGAVDFFSLSLVSSYAYMNGYYTYM